MRGLALASLPLAYGYTLQSEAAANPIRRIVTLLQDMKKEIVADGEKEEELFKGFMCYCKNNDGQLSADAEVAVETIATNNAAAEEKSGQKKNLEAELAAHKKDRAEATSTLRAETERRAKEKATYDEAAGEYKTYIEGAAMAKKALSRGKAGKMPRNPDDFLQTPLAATLKNIVSVARLDSADSQTMIAFLQGDYHTVGDEIIGILDNMLDDFDKSLGGIVKQEEQSVASFLELKKAKQSEIAMATKSIEQKSETKGRLAVEVVQHQAAAAAATKELDDAQAFLANLKATCAQKQTDWDSRSKARAEELDAIQQAIDVLSDDDALDIFKAAVKPAFVQKVSFLQTSINGKARAGKILAKLSKSPNAVLNLMAATALHKLRAASTVDFSKIIIMIDDMIKLLQEEQKHDATTQTYCQEELRKNAGETKETKAKIASLISQIESLEANIAEHQEAIAKKQVEVSELDKAVADATAQRKAENTEFNALINLNTSAVQLIEKAKNKLHKFYNPGQYQAPEERELSEEERLLKGAGQDIGDTTATTTIAGTDQVTTLNFLQLGNQGPELPAAPETYGEHKSKGKKSNSVIALLDLMQNDLKSESQAATSEEKTAQRDYENMIKDAAKQRADCEKTIADSTGAIAEAEETRNAASESQTNEETHLGELVDTDKNLHTECDFILEHFDERHEARTTEIEGLTTAKSVLSGANFQ